jgi:hypothetical protein
MSDFDGVISKDMAVGEKSPNLRAPLIGTPNRAVCASRLVGFMLRTRKRIPLLLIIALLCTNSTYLKSLNPSLRSIPTTPFPR